MLTLKGKGKGYRLRERASSDTFTPAGSATGTLMTGGAGLAGYAGSHYPLAPLSVSRKRLRFRLLLTEIARLQFQDPDSNRGHHDFQGLGESPAEPEKVR